MTAILTAERSHPQDRADSPVVPETPRFADSLTLAATRAAIGCAQMFVSHTLYHWNARFIEDDALLAVTELVTNAVKATGVMDEHPRWWELDHLNLIRVRLLGMDASIVIEVWDSDPEPPELMNPRWHCLQPRSGGKVVWGELEFPQRATALDQAQEQPLPLPRRKPRPSPGPRRPTAIERDPEVLRRVIDGLMKLDDESGGGGMGY
ncbi:ATP-binding protein [Amycolatopsis sp. H20-H5]|uniref:ATP-binding protein n=1 Tax=Amycolatopsis sp. H20-H5 TaxID=3046309 RepID=UPI002DB70CC3|nr:ATP-binding protein [Amycolatopsis sp. H20-H5]MEC3979651.1 ATP-binding protein [Amycolatopsis sp. H20-H5]